MSILQVSLLNLLLGKSFVNTFVNDLRSLVNEIESANGLNHRSTVQVLFYDDL